MSINIKTKVDMKFPNIATQEFLEQIMLKVIRPDIEGRMTKGININGRPHKPNAQKTRDVKARRGLRTDPPLIASGQLFSSFRVNLVGKNAVVMYPAGTRQPYPIMATLKRRKKGARAALKPQKVMNNNELADILQNKGLPNGTTYEFFGISKEAEKGAMKMMVKFIDEAIKRA